jgi:phosphoribosyl 1,2-cyclic phosphodiesterase
MKITMYGTRGSSPVADDNKRRYGGNTTCVAVESSCLPSNMALNIDGGSGFLPYGNKLAAHVASQKLLGKFEPIDLVCLLTHYHWDHIQGLPLAAPTFMRNDFNIDLYGPLDYEVGPRGMMESLMRRPFFPVNFAQVSSHFDFHPLVTPSDNVIVFHPRGGQAVISLSTLYSAEAVVAGRRGSVPISFGVRGSYFINECLVVKMVRCNHPEQTISYRFEERPTGRICVFMTDQEVTAAISSDLKKHVTGAHLLIQDAQYPEERYDRVTAGFGHGTGPYCVRVAKECGVGVLGLTHHDPTASDEAVDGVLAEALTEALQIFPTEDGKFLAPTIFACSDYQVIGV